MEKLKFKSFLTIGVCLFTLWFTSCVEESLTPKEMETIRKYTEEEAHDSLLYGKWKDEESFSHRGKESYIVLAFDETGMISQRMYVEDKPFNDWHLDYYYYTKEGKIFRYLPAEKGFLAMNGEISHKDEYTISKDGKTLTFDGKTYTKEE